VYVNGKLGRGGVASAITGLDVTTFAREGSETILRVVVGNTAIKRFGWTASARLSATFGTAYGMLFVSAGHAKTCGPPTVGYV